MSCQIPYGNNQTLDIEIPADSILADFSSVPGEPLDDPSAAVSAALSNPVDLPPLTQMIIPGDRIAIALDHEIPQPEAVLAGIIHALIEPGTIEAEDITVVCSEPSLLCSTLLSQLPENVREVIKTEVHDPANSQDMAFLATSEDGRPLHINRTLFDADLVLPVSLLRIPGSLDYLGPHGCLFPAFADGTTRERFQAPSSTTSPVHRKRRLEEVDEAGWLLGVQLMLQLVPGDRQTILHTVAATAAGIRAEGERLAKAAWYHEVPGKAQLVVATIEGSHQQQNWVNFARALHVASQVVEDQGVIVLCTDLQCGPGPALQRLTSQADARNLVRELNRDRSVDAVSAALLVEARQRNHIYLLSGLAADAVEDLGLGYISSNEEISHLIQQFESCILLANAHHAVLNADVPD
ncbi:MAG: lactate racemase domain-containing protein [Pirellulaceae bacterium]